MTPLEELVKRIEKLKEEIYWQCNECRVCWVDGAMPDICVCGSDISSNSTKRRFTNFAREEAISTIKSFLKDKLIIDVKNGIVKDSLIYVKNAKDYVLVKKGDLLTEEERKHIALVFVTSDKIDTAHLGKCKLCQEITKKLKALGGQE